MASDNPFDLGDDSLAQLRDTLRKFAAARAWEPYHTPKNLAMALMVEAAELLEHFQWLTPEESSTLADDQRREVAHEIADVLIYLTRLADMLHIEPLQAAAEKLQINAKKYPPRTLV